MPKTIYLGESDFSGISITWTPTAQHIDISAWYDSMVGIQGQSVTLREFFDRLGITEQHCKRAFAQRSNAEST